MIGETEIGQAIERIAHSAVFASTPRLVLFLRYIVERTLSGRQEQIKEYNIATEVLGRQASFDPKTDAIVRVEAGRLRNKLAQHYLGPGANDPIRIEIPLGGYVPSFQARPAPAEVLQTDPAIAAPAPATPMSKPRMVVIACAVLACAVAGLVFLRTDRAPAYVFTFSVFCREPGNSASEQIAGRLRQSLAALPGFAVAPRGSSDIGGEPVKGVLESSRIEDAGQVKLLLSLHSQDGKRQLCAQAYEAAAGQTRDFDGLAAELAARTLHANFLHARPRDSSSAEAVKLFAEAKDEWLTLRPNSVLRSIELYRKAIQRDPAFAKAYAGLAESELYASNLWPDLRAEHIPLAREAAAKAVSLDSALAEAHAVLANIDFWEDWRFEEGEREILKTLLLSPGKSPYSHWYGMIAALRGHDESLLEELRFGELASPQSAEIQCEFGFAFVRLGKLGEAETRLRRCRALGPALAEAGRLEAVLMDARGEFDQAVRLFESCVSPANLCFGQRGYALARAGRKAEALKIASVLSERGGNAGAALVHCGLGDQDAAIEDLKRSAGKHEHDLPFLLGDPRLRAIRSDARYGDVIRSMVSSP